jgi:hypothetical protein
MDLPIVRGILSTPTLRELDEVVLCWCKDLDLRDDVNHKDSRCRKCSKLVVIFSLEGCSPGECVCAFPAADLAFFCTNCRSPMAAAAGNLHPKNVEAVRRAVWVARSFER